MNEQKTALNLLERKEKGFRVSDGFFAIRGRLLFRAVLLLAAYIYASQSGNNSVFLLLIGFTFGMTIQDLSWYRSIANTWKFNCKITDWDKVNKIAKSNS